VGNLSLAAFAHVAELADAYGSGPYGETRGGSSPLVSSLPLAQLAALAVVSARGHITIFAINTLIGGLLGAAKIPGESSPSLGVGSDRGSLVQRAKFCPSKKQDPQARRDVSRAIRACDHGLRTDLQRVGYNAEHGFKKLDDGTTRFAKSAKEFTLGTKLGQPVGNCAARSKLHL
jgi:hypothetical protein